MIQKWLGAPQTDSEGFHDLFRQNPIVDICFSLGKPRGLWETSVLKNLFKNKTSVHHFLKKKEQKNTKRKTKKGKNRREQTTQKKKNEKGKKEKTKKQERTKETTNKKKKQNKQKRQKEKQKQR